MFYIESEQTLISDNNRQMYGYIVKFLLCACKNFNNNSSYMYIWQNNNTVTIAQVVYSECDFFLHIMRRIGKVEDYLAGHLSVFLCMHVLIK